MNPAQVAIGIFLAIVLLPFISIDWKLVNVDDKKTTVVVVAATVAVMAALMWLVK